MSKHEVSPLMKRLAAAYEAPLDSTEHQEVGEYGWVAGDFVTVRYWLGRLVGRNLFLESDDMVSTALHDYFMERGAKGACLGRIGEAWRPLSGLLRHHFELATGVKPYGNPRTMAALEAAVADPELDNAQLAVLANTTEKQVARMVDVFYVRKLYRLHIEKNR